MEIVFELLHVAGQFLTEILFQFVGELFLQIAFEALVELGLRSVRKPLRLSNPDPWLAVVGYTFLGTTAGALSVWLVPSLLISSSRLRIINILATPLAAGALMSVLGAWRRKRGEGLIRLNRFAYAFVFAFAMALVRFMLAK